MKRILMAVSLVLVFCASHAQDLKQALQNMRKEYEQSDEFHVVMQITAYEDDKMNEPYYKEKADISRSGTNYFYHFGNNDMLMNKNYLVMVDRHSKEIICNKRSPKAESETLKDAIKFDLDSILNFYETPQYQGSNNNIDHYKVVQKRGPIDRIDLFMNTNTNLLQGMNYHYRTGQVVTIVFEVFDIKPVFAANVFDEKRYVTPVKGKMKVSEAYKNYTILEETENTYR